MHPVTCINTHHDVKDLVNQGMVKNTKTWISWEWNMTFLRNKKKFFYCASDDTFWEVVNALQINTFFKKTTTCIGLQTENIVCKYVIYYSFNLGHGFCSSSSMLVPKAPAFCSKKFLK